MKAGGRPLYEVTDGNVGRVIDMRWLTTRGCAVPAGGDRQPARPQGFRRVMASGDAARCASSTGSPTPSRRRASCWPRACRSISTPSIPSAPDADGGCTGVAGRWRPQLDEAVDAGWLAGGPIDPSDLTFKQLELNAQVVRFPSGQETEFGGQAAYLMRIFGIDGDAVTEKGLENTPDTARLAADAALKARLVDYVSANAPAIDLGVYEIPDAFLAKKIISWSTFGSIRRANHPFGETLSGRRFCRRRLRADAAREVAGRADRAAGQRHLPGLPSGRLDGRLSFHRPRRQDDVAAEPHRGRRLAAFPRRAERGALPICAAVVEGREPTAVPAAVVCAAGRLETPSAPQYEPAGRPCRAWRRRMPPALPAIGRAGRARSARRSPPRQARA